MAAAVATSDLTVLTARMQAQLTWWNQLIEVTDGALNPNKCCYAFYHWQPDKYSILRLKPPPASAEQLNLSTPDKQEQIPLLPMSNGTRYLGI